MSLRKHDATLFIEIGNSVKGLSIGDYVVTGGELASSVILDSIVRLIPGVINSIE